MKTRKNTSSTTENASVATKPEASSNVPRTSVQGIFSQLIFTKKDTLPSECSYVVRLGG